MRKLLTILFLFTITSTLYPQKRSSNYFETILEDAEIFFKDGYTFYTYPLRMGTSEWLQTGGIAAGTYALIQLDDNIRRGIGSEVNEYNSDFWKVFENYGTSNEC